MTTTLPPFPARFDELQRQELYDAEQVADAAARWLGHGRVENMSRRERGDWIYRTTAYLRGGHAAWRVYAMEQAIQSVHDTIMAGDVGALFSQMPEAKRLAIARTLARAAVGSHVGALEGTSAITPGEYLKIQQQIGDGE